MGRHHVALSLIGCMALAGCAASDESGGGGTNTFGTGGAFAPPATGGTVAPAPGTTGTPTTPPATTPPTTTVPSTGTGGMTMDPMTPPATGSGGMGAVAGMGSVEMEPTPPTPPPTGSGDSSCLDGITTFAAAGPFEYMPMHQGSVKIWVPMVPAGCKVPIIHLANGTGATCSAYQNVLNRFASHGFLTTCYENTNTGAGTQGVMAIETVIMNHGEMAATKIGSTGHSQGGQAAFTVLAQAETKWGDTYTYAGLAMEPASGFGSQPPGGSWQSVYGTINSPMFMFSGTADTLVSQSWVSQGFTALNDSIEAYHWSAVGATHIPTPQPQTMEVGVPWFRWKLLGDNEACKAFFALEAGSGWNKVADQNAKACM
jgi:hypothetical protein